MSLSYTRKFKLSGLDADGQGRCKPSALLNHLQIAATLAAEEGGFGRKELERYGAFWMLARSWYQLKRPICWDEPVTIRTWHRGGRTAILYRDYDIWASGELVGESVSAWVLASQDSRRLMRLGDIPELQGTGGGELCKDRTLSKLRLPPELVPAEQRKLHYSDSDLNGHVNNTRYADFACDTLSLEQLPENCFVSSMQLDYIAECRPGETLSLLTAQENGRHFVLGVDGKGKKRFASAIFFGNVRP